MKMILLTMFLFGVSVSTYPVAEQKDGDKSAKKQIASGKKVFAKYCTSCHGANGQYEGNLPGAYLKYGEEELKKYILNAPEFGNKRMPAFEAVMKDEELKLLVVYLKFMK